MGQGPDFVGQSCMTVSFILFPYASALLLQMLLIKNAFQGHNLVLFLSGIVEVLQYQGS